MRAVSESDAGLKACERRPRSDEDDDRDERVDSVGEIVGGVVGTNERRGVLLISSWLLGDW